MDEDEEWHVRLLSHSPSAPLSVPSSLPPSLPPSLPTSTSGFSSRRRSVATCTSTCVVCVNGKEGDEDPTIPNCLPSLPPSPFDGGTSSLPSFPPSLPPSLPPSPYLRPWLPHANLADKEIVLTISLRHFMSVNNRKTTHAGQDQVFEKLGASRALLRGWEGRRGEGLCGGRHKPAPRKERRYILHI